jgi:hypothetical protein
MVTNRLLVLALSASLWNCKSLPTNIRWPPLSEGSPMVLRCPPSTLLNPTKVIT